MKIKSVPYTILITLLFFISLTAFAQTGKVPPFKMMQTNGKVFRAQDLPMGKPIVIIYFSPECDHCEKLMKDLLKHEARFKKASIVLITHLPADRVAKFVQQYNLNKHPNIYVGTEGNTFFVRNYYKIEQMPFIALHNKNGDLVKSYRKEGPIAELVDMLKTLK